MQKRLLLKEQKKGKGHVYIEEREKHDATLAALNQLKKNNLGKIKSKEPVIVALIENQKLAETKSQPIISNFNGLMARVTALGKFPWLPSLFLLLLFLAIETPPIIAKLLVPKDPYNFKLEHYEIALKTLVIQNIRQRELMLNTCFTIDNKVYKDISEKNGL